MDAKLSQFLKKNQNHIYEKGQIVLRPQQGNKQIFFILSGFIRAHTVTEQGNEFSVALLGPEMYFPIFKYISDGEYNDTILTKYYYTTVTPAQIAIVNNTELSDFLSSHNEVARCLSDLYHSNLRLLQSKLEFMSYTHSAYKKVCYFLLYLSKRYSKRANKGVYILSPFTHKELATFVGLSRESVSHQLSILKKKTIVKEQHHEIWIGNVSLLENELRK